MDKVKTCAAWLLDSFAVSIRAAGLIVVGAILSMPAAQPRVYAITLNMTYFNEGDPIPHDENPIWDPDGSILKSHFQAAKTIWETLLPGPGTYDFDFEWDDDLNAEELGLTTRAFPSSTFVEINPNQTWFADATPGQNQEFETTPTQKLFVDLSGPNQTLYFPGTLPPVALETRFNLIGKTDGFGLAGFNSSAGYDLLSVIVHEIGHVLGITDGTGDFGISPQHVGGTNGVLVQRNVDHLGGDDEVPGFLMNVAVRTGKRVLPSATDVLVIASNQGISQVHLARVGNVASGMWNDTNNWIGGAVPDATQDVYVRLATVTVDADAQAKSLNAGIASEIQVQNHRLTVGSVLDFGVADLSVDAGGTIEADQIIANDLVANAGSLVRFNSLTRSPTSSATSITFGGSVAIGFNAGSVSETFAPADYTTWNVGQNLTIGDQKSATLTVNITKTWNVNGKLIVGGAGAGTLIIPGTPAGNGTMNVTGNLEVHGTAAGDISTVLVSDTFSQLNVSGHVIVGPRGSVTFRSQNIPSTTYEVSGGATTVLGGPIPNPYFFQYSNGGFLSFDTSSSGFIRDSTIEVQGGLGHDAPGGLVTIRNGAQLFTNTTVHTMGGRRGPYSPYLAGLDEAGKGGQIRFEGSTNADAATIVNDGVGVLESRGGTGGLTVFADNSSALAANIHNHGAFFNKGGGGATQFLNNATARSAQITNYADARNRYFSMSGQTVFFDSSRAEHATIENLSGANPYNAPGRTEFRNSSSAENSTINNRGNPAFGGGDGGITEFYNTSTAANATINLYEGYDKSGRTDFYNQSTAGHSHITIVNTDPAGGSPNGGGGNLLFHDSSSADHAQITLKSQACCNGVQFDGNATAGSAHFEQEAGSGRITFAGNSNAGDATFTVGQDDEMTFFEQSSAASAFIAVASRGKLQFTHNASAGLSSIGISGASAPGFSNQGSLVFNVSSTAGNASILAHGGVAVGAAGSRVSFINGAHAGNAMIFAESGTGGGEGAVVSFSSGSTGDTARLVAEAGATIDFGDQRTFGGMQVGSIEGAGTFALNGSLLTTGNRNTSTTVSGPITNGNLGGGALTKVGTGTLTLAGANTYSGLTTVNTGTLSITGSIKNDALVGSGATLNGTGTIGGKVTVNSGGVFAPGLSPGTLALHGLTMMPNSTLNFEIGDTLRDHIMLTGSAALSGTLNVSLLGGYTPTLGQTFPVFEGSIGTITGSFDLLAAPTFNGLTFSVSQSPGSLALQVINAPGGGSSLDSVPEPDEWQLAIAGALLLLMFCRAKANSRSPLKHNGAIHREIKIRIVSSAFGIVVVATSILTIAVRPADTHAANVTVNGANGTAGAAGTSGPSGTGGGNGGNGVDATANAAAPADTSNTATAKGGIGGQGGVGGNATSGSAGDGGNSGIPGNAIATATTTANGSSNSANAMATGGIGGNGGQGGSATLPGGLPGNGGFSVAAGGTATASASVTNGQAGGSVNVQAKATGGTGGNGGAVGLTPPSLLRLGRDGGDGGSASLGIVSGTANGGSVVMSATLQGGVGGNGQNINGSGGDGANESLINAMTASTTGSISLTQDVLGGQGGATVNGAAGIPGSGASSLTLNNTIAAALTGIATAKGGQGGQALSIANGTNGASAASDISFTGKGSVNVSAIGTGGAGGNGSGSGKSGGDGGAATASANATSTMGGGVTVRAENYGGNGGSGPVGGNGADATIVNAVSGSTTSFVNLTQNATAGAGGNGSTGAAGAGGDAISTLVFNQTGPSSITINTLAAGGGSGSAFSAAPGGFAISSIDATCTGTAMNLTAQAIGNAGSEINVSTSNNNAGAGGAGIVGAVRGTAVSPGTVTLDLRAIANGGAGGSVTAGTGNGGDGAAASLLDVIDFSASTTSNATLRQTAGGGAGGSALNGLAGVGGAATNALTRSYSVNSLSVLPVAAGGAGGSKTSTSGFAGAGGNASANSIISNSSGSLSLSPTATAGAGGTGSSGANGGAGGNATASATGSNSVNQNVSMTATATGGNGGSASGAGSGGNGGSATVAYATGTSTSGSVGVSAIQNGGSGGAHASGTSGSGGNGAPSIMTNVISGSTSGNLTLTQSAISGSGGAGNGAAGGSSTNALSSLSTANPGGGRIFSTASAQSGVGGSTFGTGTPGNSADAVATIYAFSATNTVNTTASASAGAAGVNSSNMASGTRGIGTAFSHAATTGGFAVDATASVSGRNAVATAVADTSSGILSSMSLSATANPTNNINTTSVHAFGLVGNGFQSFPGNTAAHAAGLPSASDITNNLSGDPNVTAFYNSPDGKTPMALVAMNIASPGQAPAATITMSNSASMSFDVATLQSGKLLVGLLDPINTGAAFTSLHFSISREGTTVEDQTFATPAAATTYFNDHVLDFGALKANYSETFDLRFDLDMTTLDNGSRFGINFLVADVGLVGVPGDYSNNGKVDAADYVLWRKYNNTATTFPNDATPGTDPSDYTLWRSQFGQPSGSASSLTTNQAVPEPETRLTMLMGMLTLTYTNLRRCHINTRSR